MQYINMIIVVILFFIIFWMIRNLNDEDIETLKEFLYWISNMSDEDIKNLNKFLFEIKIYLEKIILILGKIITRVRVFLTLVAIGVFLAYGLLIGNENKDKNRDQLRTGEPIGIILTVIILLYNYS